MSPARIACDTISVAFASAWAWRSRASAARNAASFCPSAARIAACFSPSALRIAAWRKPSASRIFAFGLHLPRHRIDQVARRLDILDLDAVALQAPWMRGLVDDAQQARVDVVALGQRLVQVHRTEH